MSVASSYAVEKGHAASMAGEAVDWDALSVASNDLYSVISMTSVESLPVPCVTPIPPYINFNSIQGGNTVRPPPMSLTIPNGRPYQSYQKQTQQVNILGHGESVSTSSLRLESQQIQTSPPTTPNSPTISSNLNHLQKEQKKEEPSIVAQLRSSGINLETLFPHRRKLLEHDIVEVIMPSGKVYRATQRLHQPDLQARLAEGMTNLGVSKVKSPQGKRPDRVILGEFPTREAAELACAMTAPPTWDPEIMVNGTRAPCYLCGKVGVDSNELANVNMMMKTVHGITGHAKHARRNHHCRNCGHIVCLKCSEKRWHNLMLPPTFHDRERIVRVCDVCHLLTVTFADALCRGDHLLAIETYCTGNVNLFCPLSIFDGGGYPIHMAARGGNLRLLRWLIDERKCSVHDQATGEALMSATSGESVLATAARFGHVEMVRVLINEYNCSPSEIKNAKALTFLLSSLMLSSTTPTNANGNSPKVSPNTRSSIIDYAPSISHGHPRILHPGRPITNIAQEIVNKSIDLIHHALQDATATATTINSTLT